MQRQRRAGVGVQQQQPRNSNPAVENGHHPNQHAGGQLCPGGGLACVGAGSSGYGCGCGVCCTRKSSPLRRAVNTLRVNLSAGRWQKRAAGAYLAACVLLVWFGLQVSSLLSGDFSSVVEGEGVQKVQRQQLQQKPQKQQPSQRRELVSATNGGVSSSKTIPGYGEDDIGPTIAYGIMVYQRKGYSPQMTLDQFARMFNALYDKDNT